MARKTNEELRLMLISNLEKYAESQPAEARRNSKMLATSSAMNYSFEEDKATCKLVKKLEIKTLE